MTGSGFAMTANGAFEGPIVKRDLSEIRPPDRRPNAASDVTDSTNGESYFYTGPTLGVESK
jgi:hypothetical protein